MRDRLENLRSPVLMEQLKYLLEHNRGTCPRDCSECTLLAVIEDLLLQRFGSKTFTAKG
jgi:hypothetical protein